MVTRARDKAQQIALALPPANLGSNRSIPMWSPEHRLIPECRTRGIILDHHWMWPKNKQQRNMVFITMVVMMLPPIIPIIHNYGMKMGIYWKEKEKEKNNKSKTGRVPCSSTSVSCLSSLNNIYGILAIYYVFL